MTPLPIARTMTVAVLAAVICVLMAPGVRAERLATRRYTTSDGLAGDYVLRMFRDTRGFMWFSTRDGLARFDGVRFVTYGMADGLPTATINDMIETRRGDYWVATNGGGVCRLNPNGQRRPALMAAIDRWLKTPARAADPHALFVQYRVGDTEANNRVNVVFEDHDGAIWAGSDNGLFRRRPDTDESFQEIPLPFQALTGVSSLNEDSEGSLWIGTSGALLRRLPDGRMVVYRTEPRDPRDNVTAIALGQGRRIWVGYRSGLLRLDPAAPESYTGEPAIDRPISRAPGMPHAEPARWFTSRDGMPEEYVTALHAESDGRLWVGTSHGLAEFDGSAFQRRGAAAGVSEAHITDIVDDHVGGLWLSSVAGVTKIIRNGLVTFDHLDGLAGVRIYSISESPDGRLSVLADDYQVSEFDGHRFTAARLELPSTAGCPWMARCGYVDRTGDWWVTTSVGLYRFAAPNRIQDFPARKPAEIYTRRNGLPDDASFNTFQDREGNIWVGTVNSGVARLDRATGRWQTMTAADGLPQLNGFSGRMTAVVEDRGGNVWFGFDASGLVRYRRGRFERFTDADGLAVGAITSLHVDATGRLWVGNNQAGLRRVDDPTADRPVIVEALPKGALASENVRCLTEDLRAQIYVGTSRGVDRLDPATGNITHLSQAEGLASAFVTAAMRDRRGALWFGTVSGLSRLDPAEAVPVATTPTPPIFIGSLRVSGTDLPISELGDPAPKALTLTPDRKQLEIGFFGFSFESGEPLRYQYRLEGSDRDWSAPTELRSINYARLSSGHYRFFVRAVRADGRVSSEPAVVTFTVMPPFYARWWFLAMVAGSAGAIGLALYRVRVAHLLRVERVRSRIATDLHDDIGASLSQIAILAEVARGRVTRPDPAPDSSEDRRDLTVVAPLDRIAETSRSLVDSMSDIVWAINPEVDTLSDLVHRMRRFVEDTLGSGDIAVRLHLPEPSEDLRLGADIRREVFLILKESVTNIAKHAGATRVGIEFECDKRHLRLRVSDDGRGFDPGLATDGNGVASMRRRVAALGGQLTIDSGPGRGTTISLDIDLRHQHR